MLRKDGSVTGSSWELDWPELKLEPINLWSLPPHHNDSPCKARCELDDNKKCMGCGRTLYEIQNWSLFTPQEQIRIKYRIEKEGW